MTHTQLFSIIIGGMIIGQSQLAAAESKAPALGIAGDVGLGGLGGVAVTTIQTGIDVQEGKLALGLFGRLRILLTDDDQAGAVRRRDWDEVSDYVHILRNLQYSRSFWTASSQQIQLQFRAGEILGYTLGHGTLVRDYSNIADPDHPHAGIQFQLAGKRWILSSMLDNFINPTVIANRLALQPFSALEKFSVGVSVVVDPQAPLIVDLDDQGQRVMDPTFRLEASSQPLPLFGLDLDYTFGSQSAGELKPYLDCNTSTYGIGLHLGALGEIPLGESQHRLLGQIEYRLNTAGYAPAYMETFYDVERYQASLSFSDPRTAEIEDRSPKFAGLVRDAFGGHGLLAQTALQLDRYLQLKAGISYRPGPDPVAIWWRAGSNPIPRINLGLLLLMRNLEGKYSGNNGIAAMAEGRYRISDTLYSMVQYTRTWAMDQTRGTFGILQSFNISLGATWSG